MTEHVLECRWESQRCICEELRACEQRVRHEGLGVCIEHYDAGVSAAFEAVLNAGLCAPHRCQSDALAAIDSLLKERAGNPDVPPSAEKPLLCGECGTEMWPSDVGCLHLADNDDPGHIGTLDTLDALREGRE